MIQIEDPRKCSGCSACYNACPVDAIEMQPDGEGFLYPVIDNQKCIKCKQCELACPYVTSVEEPNDLKLCFAAYNKNEVERSHSSSGGIFIALAKQILAEDGIVYGAAYDEHFTVYHTGADNIKDLDELLGSKYMQSRIGRIYKEIQKELRTGKKIMFVGTGCQIGGLKGFLRKNYTNLITVDFICLGAPSPKVWKDYLDTYFAKENISYVNFKDKSLGWHTFSLRIDGKERFVKNGRKTYFFAGYFKQLYSRPSCSECIFKKGNRISDITISDCWGYNHIAPEMDDNKGLSSVECHSEKGAALFDSIKGGLEWKEADIEDVYRYNSNYCQSAPMGKERAAFWKDYDVIPKKELFEKYCQPQRESYAKRMIMSVKSKVKRVVKKL